RAPGTEGSFGVLARHAPMVAELGVGELCVRLADGVQECLMACSGGLLEVKADGQVVVLAQAVELAEEIDVARAEAAAERARQRLAAAGHAPSLDVDRARAALARALNRLRVARHAHAR
ncbi:MAG: ATP synthase F1 subunit epsilon, partial [Armatimonadetes bacterium]|nr:ATP synthase F1 subunit epsilon [Armatimonadota bacterium]